MEHHTITPGGWRDENSTPSLLAELSIPDNPQIIDGNPIHQPSPIDTTTDTKVTGFLKTNSTDDLPNLQTLTIDGPPPPTPSDLPILRKFSLEEFEGLRLNDDTNDTHNNNDTNDNSNQQTGTLNPNSMAGSNIPLPISPSPPIPDLHTIFPRRPHGSRDLSRYQNAGRASQTQPGSIYLPRLHPRRSSILKQARRHRLRLPPPLNPSQNSSSDLERRRSSAGCYSPTPAAPPAISSPASHQERRRSGAGYSSPIPCPPPVRSSPAYSRPITEHLDWEPPTSSGHASPDTHSNQSSRQASPDGKFAGDYMEQTPPRAREASRTAYDSDVGSVERWSQHPYYYYSDLISPKDSERSTDFFGEEISPTDSRAIGLPEVDIQDAFLNSTPSPSPSSPPINPTTSLPDPEPSTNASSPPPPPSIIAKRRHLPDMLITLPLSRYTNMTLSAAQQLQAERATCAAERATTSPHHHADADAKMTCYFDPSSITSAVFVSLSWEMRRCMLEEWGVWPRGIILETSFSPPAITHRRYLPQMQIDIPPQWPQGLPLSFSWMSQADILVRRAKGVEQAIEPNKTLPLKKDGFEKWTCYFDPKTITCGMFPLLPWRLQEYLLADWKARKVSAAAQAATEAEEIGNVSSDGISPTTLHCDGGGERASAELGEVPPDVQTVADAPPAPPPQIGLQPALQERRQSLETEGEDRMANWYRRGRARIDEARATQLSLSRYTFGETTSMDGEIREKENRVSVDEGSEQMGGFRNPWRPTGDDVGDEDDGNTKEEVTDSDYKVTK